MYIRQKQLDNLRRLISPGKVVVLYGARRTGKTTLVQEFLKEVQEEHRLVVSGEDITVQDLLASRSIEKPRAFVGSSRLLVIDEAQRITDIGLNLKLIVD